MTCGAGHQARPCWFVGASYETDGDQTERFRSDGIWEMEQWNERAHDRYVRQVKSMQPGDRIAIKSTYVRKNGINFDNAGKPVSVMAIKAVGEITENPGDGHSVKVNWTRSFRCVEDRGDVGFESDGDDRTARPGCESVRATPRVVQVVLRPQVVGSVSGGRALPRSHVVPVSWRGGR